MSLLIEIGVEELPAIPFLKEEAQILPKFHASLAKFNINADVKFYYTPRRLTFFSENFPLNAPEQIIEKIGAPKSVALVNGEFSKAALAFAKKCGIGENELNFKEINGKEVLYFSQKLAGRKSCEILPEILSDFMQSLNFGRSMRWGANEFEFIRPIRSLVCALNDENVPCEIYGIKSKMATFPHRNFGYEAIEFKNSREYFEILTQNGVILDQQERRTKILSEFEKIERETGLKIGMDDELFNEVVAITEFPNALLGEFERKFLDVPSEVIITSMKDNQRYFPLFDGEKLSNHFVVVSNATSENSALIVKGNEKVLRARLSDAMFFWHGDLKAPFDARVLKNVVFMKDLGTIYDKEIRECEIAKFLGEKFKIALKNEHLGEYEDDLLRAVMLSKVDLTSAMVGEFSELQGIMGSYYAAHRGEHQLLVNALYEQYLPNGENSALPSSIFSAIVALSNKFDSIISFFSIGKIPSGNKDPYALRRAASGIIKIAVELKMSLNLDEILSAVANNYAKFETNSVKEFIFDRFYSLSGVNPSVIKAVLSSKNADLLFLHNAICALSEIVNEPNFTQNFDTFKRIANIIKDEKEFKIIDEKLFQKDAERALFSEFNEVVSKEFDTKFQTAQISNSDFGTLKLKSHLQNLFALKPQIDTFFDEVIINAKDKLIKNNRLALLGAIYCEFLKIADIKEISL